VECRKVRGIRAICACRDLWRWPTVPASRSMKRLRVWAEYVRRPGFSRLPCSTSTFSTAPDDGFFGAYCVADHLRVYAPVALRGKANRRRLRRNIHGRARTAMRKIKGVAHYRELLLDQNLVNAES
jgi:hypothetical protein